MTEQTTTTTPPKVGNGGDPTAKLTVAELNELAGILKADPIAAITDKTQHRWAALALVGWALDRRIRGASVAKLADWYALRPPELVELLGLNDEAEDQADDLDPTDPTPSPSSPDSGG